ncbi:uncharacterized protein RJT21DRAFT_37328 [Scheffersomyces amazonensis]|uniref:uncharacterized protein n=1 Tax=Scheffersomyces amazonensis TaxID=1078765 RepID=UPI00315C7906
MSAQDLTEDQLHDKLISEWEKRRYVPKHGDPALPPQLSELHDKSTEDVMKELNRLPFFMTELDETDGEGGENETLEALRTLVYDGEPHEIATNFKNQGNDAYKGKQYKVAIEYYTKGLEVECDDKSINTALLSNRAACNLELKNYRKCIEDCKKVLSIDESNIKACYRAGRAFFAVERYEEAQQILEYGLTVDPSNKDVKAVLDKVVAKQKSIEEARLKKERELEHKKMVQSILDNSIKLRHYTIIKSSAPADLLEDAKIRLEDEKDYESQLIFPAMILYPTTDEFDFIAEVGELTSPLEILEMVLNRPREWFEDPKHKDFTVKKLECYMETETGGLIKVGKKISINNALMNEKPKAPLFDNGLRLYVVPKTQSADWLSKWSKEAALAKRQM